MPEYNTRTVIKDLLRSQNETLVHVVAMMNSNHPEDLTTAQNLTNKLARNTIRFSEVMEIADVLGCEVAFPKKGGSEVAPIPETEQELLREETIELPMQKYVISEPVESSESLADRVNAKFTITSGNYFKKILIIGDKCKDAAVHLSVSAKTKKSKDVASGIGYEIMLCKEIEDKYGVTVYPSGFGENDTDDEEDL